MTQIRISCSPMDNVDKWLRFYESSRQDIKKRALRSLLNLNDPRLAAILLDALVNFADQGFGAAIIRAITRRKGSQFVQPLVELLTHPKPCIRQLASEALGKLGDKRATIPLAQRLDDASVMVRREAAFALANIRDSRGVEFLLKRRREFPDDNSNVLMGIDCALKELGVVPRDLSKR